VVIGISTDKLEAQQKFTQEQKLNFPLYADTEQKVAKAFGVLMPKNQRLAQRVTFVIDKKGTVRKVYPKVNAAQHPQEVLDYVLENLAKKE
jgi:peroxiredoxin Q/BCP